MLKSLSSKELKNGIEILVGQLLLLLFLTAWSFIVIFVINYQKLFCTYFANVKKSPPWDELCFCLFVVVVVFLFCFLFCFVLFSFSFVCFWFVFVFVFVLFVCLFVCLFFWLIIFLGNPSLSQILKKCLVSHSSQNMTIVLISSFYAWNFIFIDANFSKPTPILLQVLVKIKRNTEYKIAESKGKLRQHFKK